MNINALFSRAISSAVEVKKDELIKQTLKEDHDYLTFKLNIIFANYLEKMQETFKNELEGQEDLVKNLIRQLEMEVYTNMNDLYKEFKTAVIGEEKEEPVEEKKVEEEEDRGPGWYKDENGEWDWDRDEAETERMNDDYDMIEYQEIPVDKEKRLSINRSIFEEAKIKGNIVQVLVSTSGKENLIKITNSDSDYDVSEFKYYATYSLTDKGLRISLGRLLNVQSYELVNVQVYNNYITVTNI